MAVEALRIQQLRDRADAMGCRNLGVAVAGALMLLAVCPTSIVAVFSPYWTASVDAGDAKVTTSISLWTVSTTVEGNGAPVVHDVKMCGDAIQSVDVDCGRIHVVRLLTITIGVLAFVSAVLLLVAFSPAMKENLEQRSNLCLAGTCVLTVAFICSLVSTGIVVSVELAETYSLDGIGFACQLLSMVLIIVSVLVATRQGLAGGSDPMATPAAGLVGPLPSAETAAEVKVVEVIPSSPKAGLSSQCASKEVVDHNSNDAANAFPDV